MAVELLQELLDAHLDTVELVDADVAWQRHLEYLCALRRHGEALAELVDPRCRACP